MLKARAEAKHAADSADAVIAAKDTNVVAPPCLSAAAASEGVVAAKQGGWGKPESKAATAASDGETVPLGSSTATAVVEQSEQLS